MSASNPFYDPNGELDSIDRLLWREPAQTIREPVPRCLLSGLRDVRALARQVGAQTGSPSGFAPVMTAALVARPLGAPDLLRPPATPRRSWRLPLLAGVVALSSAVSVFLTLIITGLS